MYRKISNKRGNTLTRFKASLPRKYRSKIFKLKIFNNFSSLILKAFIVLIIASFFLVLWYSRDLPNPDKVQRRSGFSNVILDREGKTVYDIYENENRIPLSFEEMPDFLKKATISIEDKDFYKHQGFDVRGIFRAFFKIVTFRGVQGGSTLTQQLVKNVLLTKERTLPRKIKEFILSVQTEAKYSKDEILQMYLNEAPYGGTMWGIESASRGYFGKPAKDLTMEESVILAGLPQSPSYYNPYNSNMAYLERAREVIRRMNEDKHITDVQKAELSQAIEKVQFNKSKGNYNAPHFVFYIEKQVKDILGENKFSDGGLKIYTTLDLELQKKAEAIVFEEMEKIKKLNATNAALVAADPQTGEIIAYVGSKEYTSSDEFEGMFDVAGLALRQPGSALKPITYAVAFEKGYTPSSIVLDVPTKFPGGADSPDYEPKNYDGKHRGPVRIRAALANSINIPAVKITALTGVKDILSLGYRMGLTTLEPSDKNVNKFGLSITLGGGEVKLIDLVQSYSVFAAGGIKNNLYSIEKIEDVSGKELYKNKKVKGERAVNENIAFLISDILKDNNARSEVFGPNSYLNIPGRNVAVKTGTTDDKRDNWTIGYSRDVTVGVWVGNNDNSPMNPSIASGVTGAAPVWARVIKEAMAKDPVSDFDKPADIVQVEIDSFLGGLPHEGYPVMKEYYIKGTEPSQSSPFYKKIKLSKSDNNRLANEIEVREGQFVEKEYIVPSEDDPTASGGENKWQQGINDWLYSQPDEKYKPPREFSDKDSDKVIVRISKPEDNKRYDDLKITVKAYARSLKGISRIILFVDDEEKFSENKDEIEKELELSPGVRLLKVKAIASDGKEAESTVKIGIREDPDKTVNETTPAKEN